MRKVLVWEGHTNYGRGMEPEVMTAMMMTMTTMKRTIARVMMAVVTTMVIKMMKGTLP